MSITAAEAPHIDGPAPLRTIVACIDRSGAARSVAALAGWAAARSGARVVLLRALPLNVSDDDRAQATLDLEEAQVRIEAQDVFDARPRIAFGALAAALENLDDEPDLIVIGKRGSQSGDRADALGGQVETVVRGASAPVLLASDRQAGVRRVALAYDGRQGARRALDAMAGSPLFQGAACDVLCAAAESTAARERLEEATTTLRAAGVAAEPHLLSGYPEDAIAAFVAERPADMLAMGAYGHSRLRSIVIGSTTSALIRTCPVPIALYR